MKVLPKGDGDGTEEGFWSGYGFLCFKYNGKDMEDEPYTTGDGSSYGYMTGRGFCLYPYSILII